ERDTLRPADVERLKGRQLKRALHLNDFIREDDFRGAKDIDFDYRLPPGYRALGIRVNASAIAGGFASLPLSRVDIISTVKRGSDKDSFSRVLLENVLVLAADSQTNRSDSGQAMLATVVTVALKPEDLVKVELAKELGPLSLALRKYGDQTKVGSDVKVTVEQIYTNSADRTTDDIV